MANNFLEQLVTEWYEYRGYFVRRNVPVGKRSGQCTTTTRTDPFVSASTRCA